MQEPCRLQPSPRRLCRADSLKSALVALERASAVDAVAKHDPQKHNAVDARTAYLRAHLECHRNRVARRAANVALGTMTTDAELQELRDTARTLVATTGALARHLGAVGQMN